MSWKALGYHCHCYTHSYIAAACKLQKFDGGVESCLCMNPFLAISALRVSAKAKDKLPAAWLQLQPQLVLMGNLMSVLSAKRCSAG